MARVLAILSGIVLVVVVASYVISGWLGRMTPPMVTRPPSPPPRVLWQSGGSAPTYFMCSLFPLRDDGKVPSRAAVLELSEFDKGQTDFSILHSDGREERAPFDAYSFDPRLAVSDPKSLLQATAISWSRRLKKSVRLEMSYKVLADNTCDVSLSYSDSSEVYTYEYVAAPGVPPVPKRILLHFRP
jgi:hypothetical protein